MPTLDFSFQDDGEVLIGSTVLVNVMRVRVSPTLRRNISTRIVAGDTHAKEVEGPGSVPITCEIEIMDQSGIAGTLNSYQIGAASGKDQVIKVRPQGTGAGLPELILDPPAGYRGMTLVDKPRDYATGDDSPPVTGTMTWEGTFVEEPLLTAQS